MADFNTTYTCTVYLGNFGSQQSVSTLDYRYIDEGIIHMEP
jgi:hypothetical protein